MKGVSEATPLEAVADPVDSVALLPVKIDAPAISVEDNETNIAANEPSRPAAAPSSSTPVGHWLAGLWILGTVAIAVRWIYARAMLGKFRRRSRRIDEGQVHERTARLAERLGMRRRVALIESSRLKAPVAFGIIRPVVALPVGFSSEHDPRRQEAVLAHELAHLAAGDPAWRLAADAVCALLWWHPLAWWQRSRLHAASEAAADEASLLVPGGPDLLAECLVALGRRLVGQGNPGGFSVEGTGFRTSLGRRVERLLNLSLCPGKVPGRGRLFLARAVMPIVLTAVAISCTAGFRPQITQNEGGTRMNVLTTSWRNSLAAAAIAWAAAGGSPALAGDSPINERLPDPAVAVPTDEPAVEPIVAEGVFVMMAEAVADPAIRVPHASRPGSEVEVNVEVFGEAPRPAGRRPVAMTRRTADENSVEVPVPNHAAEVEEVAGDMARLERQINNAAERLVVASEEATIAVERARAAQRLLDYEQQRRILLDRIGGIREELERFPPTDINGIGRLQAQLSNTLATADRIKRQLDQIALRLGDPPRPVVMPVVEEQRHRVEAIRDAANRLREAGMMEEARDLEAKLGMPTPSVTNSFGMAPRSAIPPQSLIPDESRSRLRQIEAAIDNLRAAGMPAQAEELAREAERLRAEARATAEARRASVEPQPQAQLIVRYNEQQNTIRQLGAEVAQLRAEMAQMREMLQVLLEREGQ